LKMSDNCVKSYYIPRSEIVGGYTGFTMSVHQSVCRQILWHLSLIVFEKKTKSIIILKIGWKKGNNSKMGNGIYLKIAG
jgi:hypothetical protein